VSANAVHYRLVTKSTEQCIPLPRHVLLVLRYQSSRWRDDVIVAMAMPARACRALQHCAMQSVDTLAISPNSDKSGKQSLYPDGDPDHHQNLIICSLAQCQPSVKISCKSIWKFLRKVANRQNKQTMMITYVLSWRSWLTELTFYDINKHHYGDDLLSQSLRLLLKKFNPSRNKHTHQ